MDALRIEAGSGVIFLDDLDDTESLTDGFSSTTLPIVCIME